MKVPELIEARRSIRAFAHKQVDPEEIDTCIRAACRAPAPHHSWPWRFVRLTGHRRSHPTSLQRVADDMADAWRSDLEADGTDASVIDELLEASKRKIGDAPAAVLAGLVWDGLDRYPDERRQRAEWGMARLSLGAAVQNLMLCATSLGLACCWIAAPIFCSSAARDSLDLPSDLYPEALVLIGYPDESYTPMSRPEIDLEKYRIVRD